MGKSETREERKGGFSSKEPREGGGEDQKRIVESLAVGRVCVVYLPGCSWRAWWTDECAAGISSSSPLEFVSRICLSYPKERKKKSESRRALTICFSCASLEQCLICHRYGSRGLYTCLDDKRRKTWITVQFSDFIILLTIN